MKEFIEYLDEKMPDKKGDKILFQFKRDLLTQMNERYMEVSSRGIDNKAVFCDLVMSEHTDLKKEYDEYYKKATASERRKKRVIGNAIGSVVFIFACLIAFLFVGFTTQNWGECWVIMVDGILLWVTYLLSLGVIAISKLKRIFHIFARILLALGVMTLTVAVFLLSMAVLHVKFAWLIVILGLIAMFVSDLAYVTIRKQKLAIIYYLAYIPVIFTMLFIMVSSVGIMPWDKGWLLVPIGVLVDVFIVIGELLESKHFEKEMMNSWKEN